MTDPTLAEPTPLSYPPVAAPPARSPRLGMTALLLAVAVFVLSLTASVVLGILAGPFADTSNGGLYYRTDFGSSNPAEVALSIATFLHGPIGTIIGVTALVLGIVATATGRGRRFGIPAMIIAFMAPGLSLVTFFLVMAASVPR